MSEPFCAITRWQGIIIEIGLCPTAPPIACADIFVKPLCLAISFAILPYVVTSPYGILPSSAHTAWRNLLPIGASE